MSDLDLSQFMPQENRGMNANLFKYGPKHDANFTNIGVNDQMHTIASAFFILLLILTIVLAFLNSDRFSWRKFKS